MPDFDRFRSFAERYVVSRAASFRTGHEREDAWAATMDAKTIYGNIARMATDAEPTFDAAQAPQQAGNTGSAGVPGATGAVVMPNAPLHPRAHSIAQTAALSNAQKAALSHHRALAGHAPLARRIFNHLTGGAHGKTP